MISSFRIIFLCIAIASLSSFASPAMISRHGSHDDQHRHGHSPCHSHSPSAWYQPDDHPVQALFKRGQGSGRNDYAPVGSPAWSAGYPPGKPDPSQLPQAWLDALDAAIQAGKIPDIPPSSVDGKGVTTYPVGYDPKGTGLCSASYGCRREEDVWDAPEGVFGASFDDGPLPGSSPLLYNFLQKNGVRATHFFVGTSILRNPSEFVTAFDTLRDDIAVHAWTHPYMTTLDNLALLGEFGWTMEIIHNSTGGRLPRYWRPPYGDTDNRVSAVAREVFGLRTVVWNHDAEDWNIAYGGTTAERVQAYMTEWLAGPKKPGLVVHEHELNNQSVQAFISAFPLIRRNGWRIVSVARLDSEGGGCDSDL